MELVFYNQQSTKTTGRDIGSKVRISFQHGNFAFSKSAVIKIGMDKWASIEIVQDKSRPKDWYIMKGRGTHVFNLRHKDGSTMVTFTAKEVSNRIKESCGFSEEDSLSFLLATQPTVESGIELYAIITISAKK